MRLKNLYEGAPRSESVARPRKAAHSTRLGPKNTLHPPAGRLDKTVTRNGPRNSQFFLPAGQGGPSRAAARAPPSPGVGPPRPPGGIPWHMGACGGSARRVAGPRGGTVPFERLERRAPVRMIVGHMLAWWAMQWAEPVRMGPQVVGKILALGCDECRFGLSLFRLHFAPIPFWVCGLGSATCILAAILLDTSFCGSYPAGPAASSAPRPSGLDGEPSLPRGFVRLPAVLMLFPCAPA